MFIGKLAGEKLYNKRLYLMAKLVEWSKDKMTLDVKVDEFFHDQGW